MSILMERIQRRGIPMERRIDSAYLQRLVDGYARFFETFDAAPVLVVQTEGFNPIEREADFNALLDKLSTLGRAREFLGPRDDPRLA